MTELENVRQKLAELQAERAKVEGAGLHREALLQRLDSLVDYLAEQGRTVLAHALAQAAADRPFNPFRLAGNGAVTGRTAQVSTDAGPLLVALLGPAAVKQALSAACETIPPGLSPKERAAALAALQAELDRLESEEEALVVGMEARGQSVLRRADARPEIVLGV